MGGLMRLPSKRLRLQDQRLRVHAKPRLRQTLAPSAKRIAILPQSLKLSTS
jgi:hypothetical protein